MRFLISSAYFLVAQRPVLSLTPSPFTRTRMAASVSSSSAPEDGVGLGDLAAPVMSIDVPPPTSASAAEDASAAAAAPEAGVVQWRTRIDGSIARSRKVRGGNFVQIATVGEDGRPRCRTVVFRGFADVGDGREAMRMITDARSGKVAQVERSPACEMVWWFSKTSEQYRISGDLELVGPTHSSTHLLQARRQQWGNLSDKAREQFFWDPPAKPFSGDPDVPTGGRDVSGDLLAPPDSFLLLLLHPNSVSYLRLTDNFAQQDETTTDKAWSSHRVNP